MSLGPIMMDLAGAGIRPEEREMLLHPLVGGVILFTRNYEDPDQLESLVMDLHALRDPHLIVAVDHEGGRVQRFRKGFTRLPPVALLGELYGRDPAHAEEMAEVSGWLMAMELRVLGVDMSFAPVADLGRGVSGVIGDRAFHRDPEVVAVLAHAYRRGMRMAGMAATVKHFPGHGGVKADSHLALPRDGRKSADIELADLVPFERLIHQGVEAIMTAHVAFPEVDALPVTFSRIWIRNWLRGRLGFEGVVFGDDLSMRAAAVVGGYADRACAALEAGCDMTPVCNHPEGVAEILDHIGGYADPASQLRLVRMHGKGQVSRDELWRSSEWRGAVRAVQSYDFAGSAELEV